MLGTCGENLFLKIENSAYIFTWASLNLLASDYYNKYSQSSRFFQMLALDTLLSPKEKNYECCIRMEINRKN